MQKFVSKTAMAGTGLPNNSKAVSENIGPRKKILKKSINFENDPRV